MDLFGGRRQRTGAAVLVGFLTVSAVVGGCEGTVRPTTTAATTVAIDPTLVDGSGVVPSDFPLQQEIAISIPHATLDQVLNLRIRDDSGAVIEVRTAREAELRDPFPYPNDFGLKSVDGSATTLLAVWTGTGCDEVATMHIDAKLAQIHLLQGPRKTCDSLGTSWAVVLTFGRAIVPGAVRLRFDRAKVLQG